MAIATTSPNIKVEILTNGVPLKEYDDEDEQTVPKAVTKYIESQSGAEFSIRYTLTRPWPDCSLMFDLHIDGKRVRGTFLEENTFKEHMRQSLMEGKHSSKDGAWYLEKFCFSELKTDDSDSSTVSDKLMKDLKGIGEIAVKVFRVETSVPQGSQDISFADLESLGNVPEKALKGRALSHQSSLRPPTASRAPKFRSFKFLDSKDDPLTTFNFKYRSGAALRSLMIIPRSPSPVSLEDRPIETLTPEEMRELLRRQQEQNGATRPVKSEPRVKRERSQTVGSVTEGAFLDSDDISFVSAKRRRFPVTINENGEEIIDLT